MLNRVVLQGRLTADPTLQKTKKDVSVLSFSLAVEHDYKGEDGSRGVDFIECVAWRSTAEFISKYFVKGQLAVVDGRIITGKYTDKNGIDRKSFEIDVENVYFCGSKRAENAGTSNSYDTEYRTSATEDYGDFPDNYDQIDLDEDELPF